MLPRVTAVQYIQDYKLELVFSDGIRAVLDFKPRIIGRGGVFAPLADVSFFRRVTVDPEIGTLVWPNGLDLDPDVLYSLATGTPLPSFEQAPASEV